MWHLPTLNLGTLLMWRGKSRQITEALGNDLTKRNCKYVIPRKHTALFVFYWLKMPEWRKLSEWMESGVIVIKENFDLVVSVRDNYNDKLLNGTLVSWKMFNLHICTENCYNLINKQTIKFSYNWIFSKGIMTWVLLVVNTPLLRETVKQKSH